MFHISLLKKGICDDVQNDKLLKEKSGHFPWRQKKEIYFCYNTFVSYICWQGGFFFQEYIEIELKTFFVIFEGR